jgi:hypothetical protein
MSGVELFRSFLQRATAQGSRSTALNPLGWALGIVLSAMLFAGRIPNRPAWLLPLLGVFVSGLVVAYVVAYFILLFIDRDALRSERFTLSKMALEKSVTGDSLTGFTALDVDAKKFLSTRTEDTEQQGEPQ